MYRFDVSNPSFFSSGPCEGLDSGMVKVARVVRAQGVYGKRQRFTYHIHTGIVGLEMKSGTMTPAQADRYLS